MQRSKTPSWTIKSKISSYFDVVFGPVDTADGHAQATQAALVHVAGDGAAHTQRAQQGEPAWLRGRERSQEKPTVCTWRDSWREIRCAYKLRSHRSNQTGWSGNLKAGICRVGWSQPWSQIWPGEWQGCVCLWTSEILDRSEGWSFESYQVMEVKGSKTSRGALLDPRLSLTDRERLTVGLLTVVTSWFQWHSHTTLYDFTTFNNLYTHPKHDSYPSLRNISKLKWNLSNLKAKEFVAKWCMSCPTLQFQLYDRRTFSKQGQTFRQRTPLNNKNSKSKIKLVTIEPSLGYPNFSNNTNNNIIHLVSRSVSSL